MRKVFFDKILCVILCCVILLTACNANEVDNLQPGQSVFFGAYELDGDESNGYEEIRWEIIEVKEEHALLLCETMIDFKTYNDNTNSVVTWETSSIRKWLNDEFYHTAFLNDEQQSIVKTDVQTGVFGSDTVVETEDYVFLLSLDEFEVYFPKEKDRVLETSKNANNMSDVVSSWWLRDVAYTQSHFYTVDEKGKINEIGSFCSDIQGVRPAVWVESVTLMEDN